MSADPLAVPQRKLEARTPRDVQTTRAWAWGILLATGALFVLIGGGRLDLGPIESRLGMAAGERVGPMGQVFGSWDPAIWPAELLPSQAWALGEERMPTSASVRWPAAIAGLITGVVLAARAMSTLGTRAALILGVCWFGSLGLIDRSEWTGLDLVAGMATVAALDRILARGSGWLAGAWGALAFLAAGWPPLAILVLTVVVLGRRGAGLTAGLLVPPVVAAVGWSWWMLAQAPAEAWAAALALPLTQKPAWLLAAGVLALGLPWSPLALLAASRSVREGWSADGTRLVVGWLQTAAVCVVAGTFIPGLASAARVPALAGLAVASAACGARLWSGAVSRATRRGFLALAVGLAATWAVLVVVGGIYLASAVSYYRALAIVMIALMLPIAGLVVRAIETADPRRALAALVLVALTLKLGHWGIYAPEWNYRLSQGPWGRAIGQWVPPRWPVYTTHTWRADLAFAIGRPIRQLAHPTLLRFSSDSRPKHLLLLESEFTHWPAEAPALVKVASFQDEHGDTRILARTEGPFSWRLARQVRDE
jgi:hypothetical protein